MSVPPAPHYAPPPQTRENLEWADLATVDLSKLSSPEGHKELVTLVRDAMHTNGFMYVMNHGFSQAQNERMVDIADVAFSQVSEEEKMQYESSPGETGYWRGYKPRKVLHIGHGVRDQIEMYSVQHKADMQDHPDALRPFLPEIKTFNEHNHHKILFPILRLLALGLELPEDVLVDMHKFDGVNKTFSRFQKYYPYSDEDRENAKGVWLMGHTDFTSISMIWSQSVSGLQVKQPDGTWRWVRHVPNALVVNVGDALEMLSGGFYKAAIHRVVEPPSDQRTFNRLGIFYFVPADDSVRLVPLVSQSPVLQRLEHQGDLVRRCADEDAPTMAELTAARLKGLAGGTYEGVRD